MGYCWWNLLADIMNVNMGCGLSLQKKISCYYPSLDSQIGEIVNHFWSSYESCSLHFVILIWIVLYNVLIFPYDFSNVNWKTTRITFGDDIFVNWIPYWCSFVGKLTMTLLWPRAKHLRRVACKLWKECAVGWEIVVSSLTLKDYKNK